MFELVLVICILGGDDLQCSTEVSPKAAKLEACQTVGRFVAQASAARLHERGLEGAVFWACRKRDEAA